MMMIIIIIIYYYLMVVMLICINCVIFYYDRVSIPIGSTGDDTQTYISRSLAVCPMIER